MKIFFMVLVVTGMAFTSFADEGPSVAVPQHGYSTDDIILTSLATWVVTGAKTPQGDRLLRFRQRDLHHGLQHRQDYDMRLCG